MDQKDRYGNKLREKERAEEDRYFKERERVALEKIRAEKAAEDEGPVRELAKGRCPKCGERLEELDVEAVTIDKCPGCKGIWLDDGELEALAKPEKEGWLGGFLRGAIAARR
jgi:predicted Zn-ribbon and HTH transcriptional regulator